MREQVFYDVIGDVHGHYELRLQILKSLGYREQDGLFRHPQGRKLAFLGDLIDPKDEGRGRSHNVAAVNGT